MKPLALAGLLLSGMAGAQILDPALLLKPLGDSWPTYSGDYSGKRYSSLTQLNQSNVKNLTLAWTSRIAAGTGGRGGGQIVVGGEGTGEAAAGGGTSVKGAVLEVNGVLYVSTPDNAWALDARDGRELWHYFWKTRGGTHIGNRGLGMYGNWLFMGDPGQLPGFLGRANRSGAVAQDHRQLRAAIFFDGGAHYCRQSRSGGNRRRSG